ncbi:hypothetical protein RhiJN_19740 [Ceratobasidium sp. AG-Ba]|nr:hypothetical protein RhiJN_04910 [Ceratobasidium sp. AG-Ba]QRV91722.1 hypothetical protein RhiJN_19740 [Ceratobasidium sp. AG-Ba]
MVAFKLSITSLALFLATAIGAPTDASMHLKRGIEYIADGEHLTIGDLPDWSLIFRASGSLIKGGCPPEADINFCYAQKLSPSPDQEIDPDVSDEGPSQTNFISTRSVEADGTTVKYTFKFQVLPDLDVPIHAGKVPLVRIVSKEPFEGGLPKAWLDVVDNYVGVFEDESIKPVVAVPLSEVVGKTMTHTWTVKGGPRGWTEINIEDPDGKLVLKYTVKGNTVESYRMRIGPIRLANSGSQYTALFGDWRTEVIAV